MVAVDLALAGERASYVASDNLGGARLAVRHLHGLGHRRIATIAGLAHTKPAADRLLGYRAELQELGLTPRPGYEAAGDFYLERRGSDAGAARPPGAADRGLRGVGHDGRRRDPGDRGRGLRCLEDIAVVGFDDIQLPSWSAPR